MFGVQAYKSVEAATDTPWQLIDKLYAGALQRIDEGQVDKAHAIVEEGLLGGLDPEIPFSKGFADTYDAVLVHLGPGGSVGTARRMLATLHEAWRAIRPPQG